MPRKSHPTHPAYAAMRAAAALHKWPETFMTDLTRHDKDGLATVAPDAPLFWVLRRCGTYLALVSRAPLDGAGNYVWNAPYWFPRTFGEENYRFFVWDGRELRDHGTDAAAMSETLRAMAYGESETPIASGF